MDFMGYFFDNKQSRVISKKTYPEAVSVDLPSFSFSLVACLAGAMGCNGIMWSNKHLNGEHMDNQ